MSLKDRFKHRDSRELVTDLYLITILCLFPLFFGFSGYLDITFSKYVFWLAATGLWLVALIVVSARRHAGVGRLHAPQIAALVFLGVCVISSLVSPYRRDSLLGAGRFDGLLTIALYAVMFLGISLFTRPKVLHAAAFAVGMTLCCAVGVLQLFGFDPLRLFPGTMTYYDAGTLYSGVYLGTIGNTNILDAVLCAALPLFLALYVCDIWSGGKSALFLIPLLPGCFIAAFAGGGGLLLAFAACALAAAPVLITDVPRLRRGLRGCAVALLSAGAALAYRPEYTGRALSPRFVVTSAVFVIFTAAVLLYGISLLHLRRFGPSKRALWLFFLGLDAVIILSGFAVVYLWPGAEGTVYELKSALHGQLEDGFGSSRVRIWRECLALVPERPLLGGGPGTLSLRLDIHFSRYVEETGRTLTASVDNAHNIYLGYLVNCGALGLAAYLGLLACALRTAVRALERPLTVALALSVFCAAVHGLFGLGLFLSEPVFWAVLGLLCGKEATR